MMAFAFLYQFIEILIHYFKELEEESVRDNFVVIYELLDEVLDNGYPQITDCKALSEFIKTESHELIKGREIMKKLFKKDDKYSDTKCVLANGLKGVKTKNFFKKSNNLCYFL